MSTFTLPEFWAGLESCPWSYYKSILLLQKSYLSGYSSIFLFFSSYPLNSPYDESTWNLPGAIMPKSLPPAYPSSDLQTHLPTIYLYQSQNNLPVSDTIYLYHNCATIYLYAQARKLGILPLSSLSICNHSSSSTNSACLPRPRSSLCTQYHHVSHTNRLLSELLLLGSVHPFIPPPHAWHIIQMCNKHLVQTHTRACQHAF